MTTFGRHAMGWTAMLLVVALCCVSLADARDGVKRPERPENLLPDYVQYPTKANVPSVRATRSVARLGSLGKCVPPLMKGLQNAATMFKDVLGSCVSKHMDHAKFIFNNTVAFIERVMSKLQWALNRCSSNGLSTCLSDLLELTQDEVWPLARLVVDIIGVLSQSSFVSIFNMLVCSVLPGFAPAVLYSFLEGLIFMKCLIF